jgi:hypothetical protein
MCFSHVEGMIAHHLVVVPQRGVCTVNDIIIEGCRTLSDVIRVRLCSVCLLHLWK